MSRRGLVIGQPRFSLFDLVLLFQMVDALLTGFARHPGWKKWKKTATTAGLSCVTSTAD